MDQKELLKRLKHLESRVSELEEENAQIPALKEQITFLDEQNRLKDILLYGTKSEKKTKEDKTQGELFNEAEDGAFEQKLDEIPEESKTEVKTHKRTKRGQNLTNRLSDDLPCDEIIYDIPEDEQTCDCGEGKLKEIGREETKRLEVIPATVRVIKEIRIKRACDRCDGIDLPEGAKPAIRTAEGKKHLIPGSIATSSLIAWSIAEKFEMALPFYRQEKRLASIGAEISRTNLCNWAIKASQACKPLINLIERQIKSGAVINADETPVQVLNEPGRKAQNKSYMWLFKGGPPGKQAVLFHYSPTRAASTPETFFSDYSGWLQTDDYGAYHTALRTLNKNRAEENRINHTLCWAHARRKFHKAWETTKSPDAKKAIDFIREIFELEKLRENFSSKGFLKQRKHQAEQIFKEYKKWLEKLYPETLPKSLLGQALQYTISNWGQLINYVDHTELTPSNNGAENAIRPFVIGRKNWLFSTSVKGAQSSAALYSLIETVKLYKLNVLHYLFYIFEKFPYAVTDTDIEALLPWNVSVEEIMPLRD